MTDYPAYVYKIKNLITEEFYFGFRSANQRAKILPEDDLWVKYFTSSKAIRNQIKIVGVENFLVEIIYKNTDPEVCFWKEQDLIKEHINDKLCLNRQYLDKNSYSKMFSTAGTVRPPFSNEWKQKMSDSHKGERNINYRKSLSQETLKKLTVSKIGKKQTEEHRRKNSISNSGCNNHMYGKSHTEDAKEKIKEAALSRPSVICNVCGKSGKYPAMKRWHFENCKYFSSLSF